MLGGRGQSFCSGADRKPDDMAFPEPATERETRWMAQIGWRAARAIEGCEAVTVARVHGHAVGGGSCLAMSCDFRVTAADALWWLPEVELGVPLSWGGVPRLISEIGMAHTREYLMLCPRVEGSKAAEWGLAHESVAEAELDDAVGRWVDRVLEMPELPIHITKTQLRGYARQSAMGDLSEADSDMIRIARGAPGAQERFRF